MKTPILFLGLIVVLLFGCGTITTTVGVPSSLCSTGHKTDIDYYKINTFATRKNNWELNVSQHFYKVDNNKFSNTSIGGKYYLTKLWKWAYVELGIGAKLTETDKRNPWLADSYLLADVSAGIGLRKNFDNWEIAGGYSFQHLSVPWRDDQGMNYDQLQLTFNILW